MSRDEKAKKQTNKNKKEKLGHWISTTTNSVTGGFNNLYDVLNISVYDVHMFSSACIPVFLFLHLLWEGLVPFYGNLLGLLLLPLLYIIISIFNRRIVGSYKDILLLSAFG